MNQMHRRQIKYYFKIKTKEFRRRILHTAHFSFQLLYLSVYDRGRYEKRERKILTRLAWFYYEIARSVLQTPYRTIPQTIHELVKHTAKSATIIHTQNFKQ